MQHNNLLVISVRSKLDVDSNELQFGLSQNTYSLVDPGISRCRHVGVEGIDGDTFMRNNRVLTVERFKKLWHCLVGSGEEMERMKRMEYSESRDELEIGGRR